MMGEKLTVEDRSAPQAAAPHAAHAPPAPPPLDPAASDNPMAPPTRKWAPCVAYSRHERRRQATFAAFMGFGLASWIMTNASYVELGVFLRVLPEKYGIFAYSIFALQSANIYPFLYMLLNAQQQRVRHSTAIWWLLSLGVVGALLMSLLWRQTAVLFGRSHSVAMLVLTHVGGLVSATSSVVFYPYVATFPPLYTSALSTGEGLSGSIAALIGIIQRPYDDASMRFSVEVFYVLCALIMAVSLLSFGFLERHPWSREIKQGADHSTAGDIELQPRSRRETSDEASLLTAPQRVAYQSNSTVTQHEPSLRSILRPVWPFLLCQLVLAGFSFGVLPSVMPYVYKKYAPANNREAETSRYQTIASVASLILDPIARLLTSWVRVYRVREFTGVLVVVATTLLVFSLHSQPLASKTQSGYILPLVAHVGFLVVYAYTQTMIYLTLQRSTATVGTGAAAHRVYQWSGFCTQIGAFVGTVIIFPLVFFREELFLQQND